MMHQLGAVGGVAVNVRDESSLRVSDCARESTAMHLPMLVGRVEAERKHRNEHRERKEDFREHFVGSRGGKCLSFDF